MKRWLVLFLVASCASAPKPADSAKPLAGFVWPTKGLIAEGVAFDPVTRNFFVSSVRERKIWRVTPDGEFHDFAGPDDRLPSAFGMVVDSARRTLWVATSSVGQARNQQYSLAALEGAPGLTSNAGVQGFALDDGRRVRDIRIGGEGERVFGDVVLGPDGRLWVTDSKSPNLYAVIPDETHAGELDSFVGPWRNPQGMAFSDRGELFVADYPRGIARVDLGTRSHVILPGSEDRLRGVDGIYWHDGALYAIQNGTQTPRVLRVTLNEAHDAVEKIDVLVEGPPLDDPTLGVFAEGAFFVNAVSGWGDWTETGERTDHPLSEHRLLRIDLEPKR